MRRVALMLLLLVAGCDRLFAITEVHGRDGSSEKPPSPCTPRSVATGKYHTCAVDAEGTVYCWGRNDDYEVIAGGKTYELTPTVVTLPDRAVQVIAGRESSCARLEDGAVWCWGSDLQGQIDGTTSAKHGPLKVPNLGASAEIEAGSYGMCSRDAADGSVWCWGGNRQFDVSTDGGMCTTTDCTTQHQIQGTAGAKALAMGHRYGCVIGADDRVACWGSNYETQTGVVSAEPQPVPVSNPQLGTMQSISAGGHTTCALDAEGDMTCWGFGQDGQIPGTTFDNADSPVPVVLPPARMLALASFGACALLTTGGVSCWGGLDAGTGVFRVETQPVASSVENALFVTTHFQHTCAIVDGDVLCWGADPAGQLGRGTRALVDSPVAVSSLSGATQVAAGNVHVCALAGSGSVVCWGDNDHAQAGDATLARSYVPAQINLGGVTVMKVIAGYEHSCAVLSGGVVKCWGKASTYCLGDGSDMHDIATPVTVQGTGLVDAALGVRFICTLNTTPAVSCMGSNARLQLGTTGVIASKAPIAVALPAFPAQVVTGQSFACARITDGTVSCWGANEFGQLGSGSVGTDRATPAAVTNLTGVAEIAAGDSFACARTTGGDIKCWGRNDAGQLGTGDYVDHVMIQSVDLAGQITTNLWAGPLGVCAKTNTGKVYCWGGGSAGQLGIPGSSGELRPAVVTAFANAKQIAIGQRGTCAVVGSSVLCTGEDRMRATGDMSSSVPMRPNLPVCAQ